MLLKSHNYTLFKIAKVNATENRIRKGCSSFCTDTLFKLVPKNCMCVCEIARLKLFKTQLETPLEICLYELLLYKGRHLIKNIPINKPIFLSFVSK